MKHKLSRRIRGRITEENWKHLNNAATRKGSSQSKEINAALACYYSHERDDRRDSDIYDRLDLMLRHNHRHSRDMNLMTETLSLFLQYFFTMAPNQNAGDNDLLWMIPKLSKSWSIRTDDYGWISWALAE